MIFTCTWYTMSMGFLRLYWARCIISCDSVQRIPDGVFFYEAGLIEHFFPNSPLRKDAERTMMKPMKTKSVLL